MKLTELDKKVLFELDLDGRSNYSEIARKIGTTAQVVKYHVENLLESGAIANFWAFADYEKAGYAFFWAYWLKFSGLTKKEEEEVFAYFDQNKNMPIVLRCRGYADAMICITTKDVFSHNAVLREYMAKLGKKTAMVEMLVGLGFESYPRTYLLDKDNAENVIHHSGGAEGLAKISETERKMLAILQMDGRMEFVKMVEFLGISISSVHTMFQRLVRRKIITKTAMTINGVEVGVKVYRVLFKLFQIDEMRLNELHDFCVKHRSIINYVPVMGNWQMMLDIEIESDEKLHDLIREMRYNFNDVVLQVEIAEIYKIDKFTQMVVEYPELLKTNKMGKVKVTQE